MIDSLLSLSRDALAGALADGHPVAPDALAGFRYRGVSLGLPSWVDRLAWKTFEKDFVADAGGVRGWNVRLEQTGLEGPVVPQVKRGRPHTFGHFDVRVGEDGVVDLDYGSRRNGRLDPTRQLRDPLVALTAGDATWLLGCSDLAFGRWRVRTPSYFVLERLGPVTYVPEG